MVIAKKENVLVAGEFCTHLDVIELQEIVGASAVEGWTGRTRNLFAAYGGCAVDICLDKQGDVGGKGGPLVMPVQCLLGSCPAAMASYACVRDDAQSKL